MENIEDAMKNAASAQPDPGLEKIGSEGLAYRITDYYLEVEQRDADTMFCVNFYLLSRESQYLEIRFCLGNVIDSLLQAAGTDEHLNRLLGLYPLVHEKLIRNPRLGNEVGGILKRAIDPDDGNAKWFLGYRFEHLGDMDLTNPRETLQDTGVLRALSFSFQDMNSFISDLDFSRIGPWKSIWRGIKTGLARGLFKGIRATVLPHSDEAGILDGFDEVGATTLRELDTTFTKPETFKRLFGHSP